MNSSPHARAVKTPPVWTRPASWLYAWTDRVSTPSARLAFVPTHWTPPTPVRKPRPHHAPGGNTARWIPSGVKPISSGCSGDGVPQGEILCPLDFVYLVSVWQTPGGFCLFLIIIIIITVGIVCRFVYVWLGGILSNFSCDFYVMIFKILFDKKNISTS